MRIHSRFPAVGAGSTLGAFLIALLLANSTGAQTGSSSLARYAPAEGLNIYAEFDGLDAHAAGWRQSDAWKLLNETNLGVLLEDIATQAFDRLFAMAPPGQRPTGTEIVHAAEGVFRNGIVVACYGKTSDEMQAVVAIRGGAKGAIKDFFEKRVVANAGGPANAAPPTKKGDRTLTPFGPNILWWYEKDDLVFAPGKLADAVIATLDGKTANATTHPIRQELAKPRDGVDQIALLFADISALPPFSPEAMKLGLDGLKRIDHRIGFEGRALVSEIRVTAPAPRRGILAFLDQPTFDKTGLPPMPENVARFAVLSFDFGKTYDRYCALMKAQNPNAGAQIEAFENQISDALGIKFRAGLLGHIGPKISFYMPSSSAPADANPLAALANGNFPDATITIETDDAAAFAPVFERVALLVNQGLKAQQQNAAGDDVNELRKIPGDRVGYVLHFGPGQIPPQFARLEPTFMVGRDKLIVGTKLDVAETAAKLPRKGPGLWVPKDEFATMAEHLPGNLVMLYVNDPRDYLPAVVNSMPQLVQMLNQYMGQFQRFGAPAGAAIQVDIAKVPSIDDVKQRLFPSSFAIAVDDSGVRIVAREALPSIYSPTTSGVLVALMLPAVQSSREAARRAQCLNNLKQIGLALHNYHSTFDSFPKQGITDKDGKPLLSWRVAILPYIEQQALYNKFHLDEPWDSEHNKALLNEMPKVFACPSRTNADPTKTHYQGFVGEGAFWDAEKPIGLVNITDGTSNTIAVVEAENAVPWTKPEDIKFDPKNDKGLFGAKSEHPGGFNALFGDGSVRFIKTSVAVDVFRALITRAGGEVIQADAF